LNGFDNETLVIAEVTYIKDNNGTTCEIRVGPADAYLPEPAAPKKKKNIGRHRILMAGSSSEHCHARSYHCARYRKKMPGRWSEVDRRRTKENVEHLEPYGFTSAAQDGAEAVMLFPGGDRSHGVAVVVADRRYRLKGLVRGEVAIYDDQGQSVTLTRAGIVVNGGGKPIIFTNAPKARFEMDIEATGEIKDLCDGAGKTMSAMRTTYNGHTHKENGDGGGTTDPPNQPMS
jgi:phage gp45-like